MIKFKIGGDLSTLDMNISRFLQEIEDPFIKYLYKHHMYPSCCHVASNLVSTFLSVLTEREFFHKFYCSTGSSFAHSWVQQGDFVIDLVWYQHELDDRVNSEESLVKAKLRCYLEHLKDIKRPPDSIFDIKNLCEDDYPNLSYYKSSSQDVPNQVEYIKDINSKFTKDFFLDFVKQYAPKIKNKLTEKIDPNTGKLTLKCLITK